MGYPAVAGRPWSLLALTVVRVARGEVFAFQVLHQAYTPAVCVRMVSPGAEVAATRERVWRGRETARERRVRGAQYGRGNEACVASRDRWWR